MTVSGDTAQASALAVRTTITATIIQVAEEQGKQLALLSDRLPLMDSGLDSLCIAIIVARLDDELGIDPFSSVDDGTLPVTIGDFIRIYENAAA
jgi:hypothetical protein